MDFEGCKFQISVDAETGEEEYLAYCEDHETGEKHYFSLQRICKNLNISNPFNRYSKQFTRAVKKTPQPPSQRRMEFITAIVFLIPTFIIFTPLLGMGVVTFAVILHKYCHKKNAKLAADSPNYYKSPLHPIFKEFCSQCVAEEMGKKMSQIQNIRNTKRTMLQESFKRVA